MRSNSARSYPDMNKELFWLKLVVDLIGIRRTWVLPGSLVLVRKESLAGWQPVPPHPQTSEPHQPFKRIQLSVRAQYQLLTGWALVTWVNNPHYRNQGWRDTYHIPQDGILQGSVPNDEVEGIGTRDGVELGFPLCCVQLKLVQILAVGFSHKHDLLASFLVEQSYKSLWQTKCIYLNLKQDLKPWSFWSWFWQTRHKSNAVWSQKW